MVYCASFSNKAQMKIQQMVFVLVAIVIFFALVFIFYIVITLGDVKKDVATLRAEGAKELLRSIASTPEFIYSKEDCSGCVDKDKLFVLKSRKAYEGFWDLDFLKIQTVYPINENKECDNSNYPNCNSITLIEKEEFGTPQETFVLLCYWNNEKGGYKKCEIGKIFASGKAIE